MTNACCHVDVDSRLNSAINAVNIVQSCTRHVSDTKAASAEPDSKILNCIVKLTNFQRFSTKLGCLNFLIKRSSKLHLNFSCGWFKVDARHE